MATILHIANDEKFINAANSSFEKIYPSQNQFLIVSKNSSLRYVKPQKNIITVEPSDYSITPLIENAQIIFFHSYTNNMASLYKIIPKDKITIWFCFGMEIYNDPNFYPRKKLLAPLERSLIKIKKRPFKKRFKDILRPYVRVLKKDLPLSQYEEKLKTLKSFDFIAATYKEEFNFINNKIGRKARWFEFSYFSLEYMVGKIGRINLNDKQGFFIGNSGHITNNHLEVFDRIHGQLGEINENILVPLGYGNSVYIEKVIDLGKLRFSLNFKPILDFLPLEEYNNYLYNTRIGIFNARRQQGVGTIIPVLYHGAKVFLSKHNTFYHYLKRLGVLVFCYETQCNAKELSEGLTPEQILHNRKILYQALNEQHLLQSLAQQLQPLLEDAKAD